MRVSSDEGFPSSLDSCLCLTAGPTFLSYWTKVQYTAFSLYARSNERRVTREELLRTLYSILFPRHSFARPRLCRKRDGSNKRTRNFCVIDDCFLARTAIESGSGVTTTQYAASQRRITGETDPESIPNPRRSAMWQNRSLARIGSCASRCSCCFRSKGVASVEGRGTSS